LKGARTTTIPVLSQKPQTMDGTTSGIFGNFKNTLYHFSVYCPSYKKLGFLVVSSTPPI